MYTEVPRANAEDALEPVYDTFQADAKRDEAAAKKALDAATRAGCMARLRRFVQTDHRGRFVYPNGWLSITNRRVACKERDETWELTRGHRYISARAAQHGCTTVVLALGFMVGINVLSAYLLL